MNRNETWFTELWEKRNNENFHESFKEDFRIYPTTFVSIVNLVVENISKQDKILQDNTCRKTCCNSSEATGDWRLISK